MKKTNLLLTGLATISLSTIASAGPSWAKKGDVIEKCQGVAKKGMNDCGANGHSCANQAKADNDPQEWVYTPEGLCKKIGGKIKLTKTVK